MAVKYWYKANNGSDNWSVATNWYTTSGGTAGGGVVTTVPTSADDVVFDANSGTGTITVAATSTCNSFDATAFRGTLAGTSALNITNQTTRGNSDLTPLFAFGPDMISTHTGTVTFGGTSGLGGWIFCNGVSFKGPVTFNNAVTGCTFEFRDTFITSSTSLVTLTNGNIIGNNADVIIGRFSSGTGVKSIICGNLYLTGTGTLSTTSSALTSTIDNIFVTNDSATAKSLTFNTIFGSTNLELGGSGSGSLTFVPGTTFKPYINVTNIGGAILSISTGAITDLIFDPSTTVVWTNATAQTLTMWGNLTFTPLQPAPTRTPALLFNQATSSQITMAGKVLVTGAITVNNPSAGLEFLDDFNCPLISLTATDSSVINVYGNFTCASIVNGLSSYLFFYKNLTCGSISNTGSGYILIGAGYNFDCQVNVTTVSLSGTGASPTLDINAGTFNCTTMSITNPGTIACNTQDSNFPVTVNCSSVTISGGGTLNVFSLISTPSNFNCIGAFSTTNGNFQIIKSVAFFTTFSLSGASSTMNMGELGILYISGAGSAFTIGATISLTSTTNSKIEFTNTSNTAITFNGGSWLYYEVVFNRVGSTGTNTISGSNYFTNFRDLGTAAHTISFGGGTTQQMGHFDVRGNPGNLITLTRSSSSATYVSKFPRGVVLCDYIAVTNLFTDDPNTWYAGPNSTVTNSSLWVDGGRVRQQSALGVG